MIISDLYQTKISCSKYRMNVSETITVTVKLEDFNKAPVTGKSVTLSVDYGKILSVSKGTGGNIATGGKSVTAITSSDGEITVSYQAQDTGLCTFIANNTTTQILVGWEIISSNKWYSYSNSNFTFDKRNWAGKLILKYNPNIGIARLYFNFSETPFTKSGTMELGANASGQYGFTLGNEDNDEGKALVSTALRPPVRELGIVHVYDNYEGQVIAALDTNGKINIINSVNKIVNSLHGIIWYRYADKYNVIKNKFSSGTLTDIG